MVAWVKANPGKLNFANFGTGMSSHVYAAAFAKLPGIDRASWIAIVGPAGMPADLVAKVNAVLAQALNSRQGLRPLPSLYASYHPMPCERAREMEVELAIGLRGAGYGVWQA